MKIEGKHQLQAAREEVYGALTDPDVLLRTIPGCQKLEQTGEGCFSVTLKSGAGSIKGIFTGTVRLEDIRPPLHYRIVVEGRGQPGFLKGSGDLDLKEANGGTEITYSGEAQVGGTIAGVGQRMIEGAARMMASQFFEAIESETRKPSP
ncbi:MAG TPA: carbon monoxide dehydrogenase subunit G [Blastocatellia bacterium]|nr:carbon monoxide dehydrogenase subunit G [Blastocatellia bacterium]